MYTNPMFCLSMLANRCSHHYSKILVIYNKYLQCSSYITNKNIMSVYIYINENVRNISNMHQIADITIKIRSNFPKLVSSHVSIHCNKIFDGII